MTHREQTAGLLALVGLSVVTYAIFGITRRRVVFYSRFGRRSEFVGTQAIIFGILAIALGSVLLFSAVGVLLSR